jgi:hypothetical protein
MIKLALEFMQTATFDGEDLLRACMEMLVAMQLLNLSLQVDLDQNANGHRQGGLEPTQAAQFKSQLARP